MPEQPQNITATQVHSSYLVLSWGEPFDNYAPVQGYYVFYNPLVLGGEDLWQVVLEPAVNLTDLHPGITYNVLIVAFSEIGNSSESEIVNFETLEEGLSTFHQYHNIMSNSCNHV